MSDDAYERLMETTGVGGAPPAPQPSPTEYVDRTQASDAEFAEMLRRFGEPVPGVGARERVAEVLDHHMRAGDCGWDVGREDLADALLAPGGPVAEIVAEALEAAARDWTDFRLATDQLRDRAAAVRREGL